MSDFKRQHPVAAITRSFELIRGNLITIVVFLILGTQREEFPFVWMFVGMFALLLVSGVISWWRFIYKVEEGELHIKRGLFVRKNLYLSSDRIQVIDFTAGIIQRMFGLVSVQIQTAGSTSREASLSAVTRADADELVFHLRKNINDEEDVQSDGEESPEMPRNDKDDLLWRDFLPGKELIIAASTSGSFGIALSIILTLYSQLEPVISDTRFYEWVFDNLPTESDTSVILGFIVSFIIISWLFSFLSTIFSYGDFCLTTKKDEFIITRGIFEKKRITIPFNRIQAVKITEGILRQPFGYATLSIESAGYGDQAGSGTLVLFPLIKKTAIPDLFSRILPQYKDEIPSVKPPVRAARRYMFRNAAFFVILAATGYFLLDVSEWIALLAVPGLFWGWLKYRDAGLACSKSLIIVRTRAIARNTTIMQRYRLQDMNLNQSFIQKWRDLITLNVNVASGDHGYGVVLRDLEGDLRQNLIEWMARNEIHTLPGVDERKELSLPDFGIR